MKTLISLGMAAFVLGFIFSADLIAAETLEQRKASLAAAKKDRERKLIKAGWVKLTATEIRALTNFTASDDAGWAEYIDTNGTKVVTQWLNGEISKGTREITADGRYCYDYVGWRPKICWLLLQRAENYFRLTTEGMELYGDGQFTIKSGNTENL